MPEEKDPKEQEEQQRQIMQSGSVTTETHGKHVIHCLTICRPRIKQPNMSM